MNASFSIHFPLPEIALHSRYFSRDTWLLAYASVALNLKRNTLFLNNYIPEHKILFKAFSSVQKRLKGSKNATLCVLLNEQSCRNHRILTYRKLDFSIKKIKIIPLTSRQCHSIHCSQERSLLFICSLSTIPLSRYQRHVSNFYHVSYLSPILSR